MRKVAITSATTPAKPRSDKYPVGVQVVHAGGGSTIITQAGGESVDVVKTNEVRAWTDENVLSALRSLAEFISKKHDGESQAIVDFLRGLKIGGSFVDRLLTGDGDEADVLDSDVMSAVRVLVEIGRNNEDIKKLFLSKVDDDTAEGLIAFLKGIVLGEYDKGLFGTGGAFLIDENNNSWGELDYLTIRKKIVMRLLEVMESRHIGGEFIVSPAAMVCTDVVELEDVYRCYFKSEDSDGKKIHNQFVVGDQARCQTFNLEQQADGTMTNHYFWRLVEAIGDDYIDLSKTDYDKGSDAPLGGDNIAQLGNRTDTTRQNAQILSSFGIDAPSYKQYVGIDSYSLEDKYYTGLTSKGNRIQGNLILETGEDVKTKIEMVEGKIRQEVESVRKDVTGYESYLSNAYFDDDVNGWHTDGDVTFFLVGNKWVWMNNTVYSKKNAYAGVRKDGDRTALYIKNCWMLQHNVDFESHPTFEDKDVEGNFIPKTFYLQFYYRCLTPGTLKVEFENADTSGFAPFEMLSAEKELQATDGAYMTFEAYGLWNGTGDFKLSFTGEIYLYAVRLGADRVGSVEQKFATLYEQTAERISIIAANFNDDGSLKNTAGLMTTAMGNNLFVFDSEGNLVSMIEQTAAEIKIKASQIEFEGLVTANKNFQILEDGSIVANKGVFNNVVIDGSLRSPFARETDSIDVGTQKSTHDNVVPISSGNQWGTAGVLEWDVAQSGRRMCIANYRWEELITEGYVEYTAPTGMYFYEDGLAKTKITVSRECVELMGYGTSSTFYGWIVLNRIDLKTTSRYGRNMKILAMGEVDGKTNIDRTFVYYRTFDKSTLSAEKLSTGMYRVHIPSEWGLSERGYIVQLTGNGYVLDSSRSPSKATLMSRMPLYFDVMVSDDDSANNGSFFFTITNLYDWMYI